MLAFSQESSSSFPISPKGLTCIAPLDPACEVCRRTIGREWEEGRMMGLKGETEGMARERPGGGEVGGRGELGRSKASEGMGEALEDILECEEGEEVARGKLEQSGKLRKCPRRRFAPRLLSLSSLSLSVGL